MQRFDDAEDEGGFTVGRRELMVVAVGVAVVLIGGLLYMVFAGEETVKRGEARAYTVSADGETTINTSYHLRDSGYVEDPSTQQIMYGSYGMDFEIYGIYNGSLFLEQEYVEDGETKMRVGKDIKPGDGVPEGFMAAQMVGPRNDSALKVTIYIDQEFRNEVFGQEMIAWGLDYEHARPFRGEEITDGVYRDVLYENDTRRFLPGISPSNVNALVGNVKANISYATLRRNVTALYAR